MVYIGSDNKYRDKLRWWRCKKEGGVGLAGIVGGSFQHDKMYIALLTS